MTTAEAAKRWGRNLTLVSKWCRIGLIPGAQLIPRGEALQWDIPPDAEPPKDSRRRSREEIAAAQLEEKPEAPKPEKKKPGPKPQPIAPPPPLSYKESVEYIKKNSTTKTYKQLRERTGLPSVEIRRIYDALFAKGLI